MTPDSGRDPSGQDAHNPETEEDTASGGPADPPDDSGAEGAGADGGSTRSVTDDDGTPIDNPSG